MRATIVLCAAALLHTAAGSVLDVRSGSLRMRQDEFEEPDDNTFQAHEEYLNEVCAPSYYSDGDADNTNIQTPCEAFYYIDELCQANGTEPIDYLAQQECVCGPGSGYFDMFGGCNSCFEVHGGVEGEDWFPPALIGSVSANFCTGTPQTDIDDLFDSMVQTAIPSSAMTTANDLFPSQTAVSLYFTGTLETAAGEITGSALAATWDPSAYWGVGPITDEPPQPKPTLSYNSSTVTSMTSSSTATRTSTAKAHTTSTASGATATGAAAELKAMGGILAMVVPVVGAMAVL